MSPPRRILMTADAVGGVFTYALDLAASLGRRGIETTLVTLGPAPDAAQRAEARSVPGLNLIETGLPLDWLTPDEGTVAAVSRELAEFARRFGADTVHLNAAAQAIAGDFPCPVLVAHHSCLATWWRAVRGDAPMPCDFMRRAEWTARGLAAADLVVAPSRTFAAETAETYGIPLPAVVLNGRTRAAGGAVRASDREGFAVTAGRLWDEGKNTATLDEAAKLLGHAMIAAGPQHGPNGTHFRPAKLLATGKLDEARLRDLFRRAAVFASAARYEPFGLTALEAAQTGCPLVLSDIPTHRELWDGAAIFVPADDAAGFAAAMRAVIDKPALRADLAAAARERAARYSVESMAEGLFAAHAALSPSRSLREAIG